MPNLSIIGETSRTLVRSWIEADAMQWLKLSQDDGLNKFSISGYRLTDIHAAQATLMTWTDIFRKTQLGPFPIILKATSEIIGICALKPVKLDDESFEQIEIMYRLGQKNWKQGFATEAGIILLQYAFNRVKLPHIIGFVLPDNTASRAVLLRLGMKFIRNSSFSKHQVELYQIHSSDFFNPENNTSQS